MSGHTPLPWVSDPAGVGCLGDISTPDGQVIAQTQQVHGDLRHVVREANKDFILRACNSHYELLEALEEFSREYDGFQDGNGDPCPTLEKARAAIAKAKGTNP